jgi:hypothetical protein
MTYKIQNKLMRMTGNYFWPLKVGKDLACTIYFRTIVSDTNVKHLQSRTISVTNRVNSNILGARSEIRLFRFSSGFYERYRNRGKFKLYDYSYTLIAFSIGKTGAAVR